MSAVTTPRRQRKPLRDGVLDRSGRYDPWMHLAMFPAVTLAWVDNLPADMYGYTDFPARNITLLKGLTSMEERSTLAHEVVHLERGPLRQKVRSAREWDAAVDVEEAVIEIMVAARLIPSFELAKLEGRVQADGEEAVADDLGVDVSTLHAAMALATAVATLAEATA